MTSFTPVQKMAVSSLEDETIRLGMAVRDPNIPQEFAESYMSRLNEIDNELVRRGYH